MAKKLTVIIHNLDEEYMKEWWKDSKQAALEELGVQIKESEIINIDAIMMIEHYPDIIGSLMGSIISGHAMWTADKIFNPQKESHG